MFGLARTVLGVVAGVSFALLAERSGLLRSELLWYVCLFPVRLMEWLLVLWLFFERKAAQKDPGWLAGASMLGSLWSYVLDVPAVLSVFVVPGGMWVC